MEQGARENREEPGLLPGSPAPGPRESGLLCDPVLLQVSLHCRLNNTVIIKSLSNQVSTKILKGKAFGVWILG